MSDSGKRRYSGATDRLFSDVEQAINRVRGDINATAAYEASNPSHWSGSPPTTIAEALDRLAANSPGA